MSLKRDLLSGAVAVVPVFLVIYIVYWIVLQLSGIPLPFVLSTGDPGIDVLLRAVLVALAVLLVLIVMGRFTRTLIGSRTEHWLDRQMNRIPAVRMVYNASKVALEMALNEAQYKRPVRVKLTDDLSVTGFKTGTGVVEGRESVFVPTSPNITTGLILYVEPGMLVDVDESVEDVLSHVLSAGFLGPGEAEERVDGSLELLLGGGEEP